MTQEHLHFRPQGFLLAGDALDLPTRLASIASWDGRPFDLVYLDPPFNVGSAFAVRRKTARPAFDDAWGGLDAFLDMLAPRLAVLRDAMAEQATLWLHLDHRAVHDAKVRADRIFGRAAFRGEIVWMPGNGARGRGVPSTHQTILVYSRDASPRGAYTWNEKDPALREPYATTSLSMHFTSQSDDGRRFRERTIAGKTYRYYADEGRKRGSVWSDVPAMLANTPLRRETTGYPTQKPLALLERIVLAASRPGDLVVDPMCGSGTTLEAAARLERRFVGNDVGAEAIGIAKERLARAGVTVVTE